MTETNTRQDAIVTPSSSLLRTIVSSMGTLTFTSVASFYYYYYYRPNTTSMTKSQNIGVVLFQSVASLWGWKNKSRSSPRKKSKSPGRRKRDGKILDPFENDHHDETKRDVCVSLFDNMSDDCEDASENECSDCDESYEETHQNSSISDAGITQDTPSAYGMQELVFQVTARVVESSTSSQEPRDDAGLVEEANAFTVVEEDPTTEVSVSSGAAAPNTVEEAPVVVVVDKEDVSFAEAPARHEVSAEESMAEDLACEEVTVEDWNDINVEERQTMEVKLFVGDEVTVDDWDAIVAVFACDELACEDMDAVAEEKQNKKADVFDCNQVNFGEMNLVVDETSENQLACNEVSNIVELPDGDNVPGHATEIIEEDHSVKAEVPICEVSLESAQKRVDADVTAETTQDASDQEIDEKVDMLSRVRLTDEEEYNVDGRDEVADQSDSRDTSGPIELHLHEGGNFEEAGEPERSVIDQNCNEVALDGHVLDEFEIHASVLDDERDGATTSQAIFLVNEASFVEAPLSVEIIQTKSETKLDTSGVNEASEGASEEPSHFPSPVNFIVEEDPAVVTDEEILQCDSAAHSLEELLVDQESDDSDVSYRTEDREEDQQGEVKPDTKDLYDQGSVKHDEHDESSCSVNDVPKLQEEDDDIPGILQLDTLTFDDTSAADDDEAHIDLTLSSISARQPLDNLSEITASRKGTFIGKASIFLLCGGVLLLHRSWPWQSAEFLGGHTKPSALESTETVSISLKCDTSSLIEESVLDSAPEESELSNVSNLAEQPSRFNFDNFCTDSETGVASSIFQGLFISESVESEHLNVTNVAKDAPIFGFDGTSFIDTGLPVIFKATLVEIKEPSESCIVKQTSVVELFASSVLQNSTSADSSLAVNNRAQRKVSDLSKSVLLQLHGLILEARRLVSTPLKVNSKHFSLDMKMTTLKDIEQAALGPFGLHYGSWAFYQETASTPLQTRMKQLLSAMTKPLILSETAKDAFITSHGVLSKPLVLSTYRANITNLLPDHTVIQSTLCRMLNELRVPLKVSNETKEAFQISHGAHFKSLVVSPVTINVEPLLRIVYSPNQWSDSAREAVLASHGLYPAPMTLFPEHLHLLILLSSLCNTAKEVAKLQLEQMPSVLIQHLRQHVLAMSSLAMQMSTTGREAFMASHGPYGKDLAAKDALIKDAVVKVSEIAQRTFLTAYAQMLSRVPEQKVVIGRLASNMVSAAGNANSGLQNSFWVTLTTAATLSTNVRSVLSETKLKVSDETKQAALGFYGQYYATHEVQSDLDTAERKLLFLEMWSTIASCNEFLDHSVVLWSQVGDEALNMLNNIRSS
ncbi:hypothetical protein FisN_15Lh324 [Fistulifera solaris]|uniref:Uncharacterized protein n=1 Tax=Fistulifera solaris TaxID=1519565 RepID=A0A1Z5JWH0_FISSO|nr:hypothetical protein FisN_15Lh324 [Fistulifera solaris]|eukprot:GAX18383.1 hypothetical protein FisN_15Lh324 [Fistulifera solaris]